MKTIFLRHGETSYTREGLAQGGSDDLIKNELTVDGREDVYISAKQIAEIVEGRVFIYTANQRRTIQSAEIVSQVIKKDPTEIMTDNRLNGRSYGNLEGLKESELRKPQNLIAKANLTWPYIFAQLGVRNNCQKIETKAEFESRIYNFLLELMLTRKSSDTVLIVGGSDVWKAIRKMEDVKLFCPDINPDQKLECGEFAEFKMVRPTICVQSGKFKQGKENSEMNK